MIKLYQFPLSHFCEKARWGLDRKRIPYKLKTLLPGLHAKPMIKLAGKSSLPVLKDGKDVVQGASEILSYLDETYPRFPITPEDVDIQKESTELEAYFDDNIGPQVRLLMYSVLLDHPELIIPLFADGGPFYSRFLLNKKFPLIQSALRKRLPINAESIEQSKQELRVAIDRLKVQIGENDRLVGGVFTRADLTAASLLAPMFKPSKFGGPLPSEFPEDLQALVSEFKDIEEWVLTTYQKYR